MITASKLQHILTIDDDVFVLYGYTFDRNTLAVFFRNNKIVKVEYTDDKIVRWEESNHVWPLLWTQNVKRWYADSITDQVKELTGSFLEYGLTMTAGGHKKFLRETPFGSAPEPDEGTYFDLSPND